MKKLITVIVLFLIMMTAIGGMIAEAQNITMLSIQDRQKIENKFSSFIYRIFDLFIFVFKVNTSNSLCVISYFTRNRSLYYI
jgi:hypothetical protein